MKDYLLPFILYIIVGGAIISIGGACNSYHVESHNINDINKEPIHDTIYIPIDIVDTIYINDTIYFSNDDSLKTEILLRDYKLIRIKEYCRIAQQGNNIKYLRGWILRVLND